MNLENVEIFNAGALEAIPGFGENGLMRIPEKVRKDLNDGAKLMPMDSVGCEVRFVTNSPNADISLSCSSGKSEIRIFKGNFLCATHEIEPGKVYNIRLVHPGNFDIASTKAINEGGFSSDVWRIICNRGTFALHGIDPHGYDIRPPKSEEKPDLNWLAYGSSITNSSLDGYPHFAAKKLKIQVQNKGLAGACQLEKELVDYFVDECEWDFATCELGINVRDKFSPEEFEQRASYLIDRFTATGKPVLIISVFPNCRTSSHTAEPCMESEQEDAFNRILPELVSKKNAANLHFVAGSEILDDFTGLSGDLLHPCRYGHAVMGANLAEKIKDIL